MKPKFCVFCGGKLKHEHRIYVCVLCGAEIRKYGEYYTAIKKTRDKTIRVDLEVEKIIKKELGMV